MSACRRCDSSRVSDEVGSSMTMTLAPRQSARRISTFCWSAMLSARTRTSPGTVKPLDASSASKLLRIAPRSTNDAVPRLDAEEDVLHHRHVRRERQLLGDERHTVRRAPREAIRTGPPRRRGGCRPSVAADRTGDHLPDRRLPRTVRADERVHRPGGDRQTHAVDRQDVAEPLRETLQLDAGVRRDRHDYLGAASDHSASSSGCSSVRTFLFSATTVPAGSFCRSYVLG